MTTTDNTRTAAAMLRAVADLIEADAALAACAEEVGRGLALGGRGGHVGQQELQALLLEGFEQ